MSWTTIIFASICLAGVMILSLTAIKLARLRVPMRAEVGKNGVALSTAGAPPSEEPAGRREIDTETWAERFTTRIVEGVRASLAHECVQADIIRTMAEGHEKHTDAFIRFAEIAHDHDWNGDTVAIKKEQEEHKKEFHEMVIGRAFGRKEAMP